MASRGRWITGADFLIDGGCTGATTRCRIADHVALPSGATRLLAWGVKGGLASGSHAKAPVPAPVRKGGAPLIPRTRGGAGGGLR